jgi:hypothetical protein
MTTDAGEGSAAGLKASRPAGRLHAPGVPWVAACASAWPLGPAARPRRSLPWARRTVHKRTEAPRLGLGSTPEFPRLPYTGARVLRRVAERAGVPALFWSAATPTPNSSLIRLGLFEIAKLQNVPTKSKISEKKSCRGAIDLQLSQRASYVLINRLPGNVDRSCRFSTAQVTVHKGFKSVFG